MSDLTILTYQVTFNLFAAYGLLCFADYWLGKTIKYLETKIKQEEGTT